MTNDHDPRPRRDTRPLLLIPLLLTAALIGYLLGDGDGTGGKDGVGAQTVGASSVDTPQVTRASGDSEIRSHDGSGTVNLRSCPGAPAAGERSACGIVDGLPDGTVVTMECWIDGRAVPGRAPADRRWFLVTPGAGAPHPGRRGYVFSAEIPVEQQIRTPWCSNDLINELLSEPEPTVSPATPEEPAPAPEPATPSPAPTKVTPASPTPTTSAPAEPAAITATVTVENQVTDGEAMREDTRHPAYLSSEPVKLCKDREPPCEVGRNLAVGERLTALCQVTGDEVTNGWNNDSRDDGNPGLDTSSLWYELRAEDGTTGYLSVIWLAPDDRGGLGLPRC
ncbi:hypothetical protein ACH4TV_44735 [Streptomyces sp. NPDC020898]|uniref:hypothetical protein n=1 Tax=Streptomyces sp. NPDC020898 TaxID=3365101 RepID=UPI0037B5741F